MPGAAAASFFDATTQRICDHVGKDWVVRDWSNCSCFCKVHFLTVFPFLRISTFFTSLLSFLTSLLYSSFFAFLLSSPSLSPHFSTFFTSLLSSLPYCPHFSTFLTSLLCSLLYFLHFLYCPHFPAVFTSLLYSLTLRSSHLYFLHLPSAFTSLLSSLPSCLHFPTGPELFPKQRVHTEGFLR